MMVPIGKVALNDWNSRIKKSFADEVRSGADSLGELVLDFFVKEEEERSPANGGFNFDEDSEDRSENSSGDFWEKQQCLLQAALRRISSLEQKIRMHTTEIVENLKKTGSICICRKPNSGIVGGECRSCLIRNVSDRMRSIGYDCAVCKSKSKSSLDAPLPSGEHAYLDVIEKESTRIVIELRFRSEFEMARASKDYIKLMNQLPEIFTGKPERLRTVVKIMCMAAKRCMKENKMHIAPWRKQKYMEAKWFGTSERVSPPPLTQPLLKAKQPKLKASMLTYDLIEKMPNICCTAVEVV